MSSLEGMGAGNLVKRKQLDAQLACSTRVPGHCTPVVAFLRARSRFHIDKIAEAGDELPEFLPAQLVGFCAQRADSPLREDLIESDVRKMRQRCGWFVRVRHLCSRRGSSRCEHAVIITGSRS
jgi:hypothetical protein